MYKKYKKKQHDRDLLADIVEKHRKKLKRLENKQKQNKNKNNTKNSQKLSQAVLNAKNNRFEKTEKKPKRDKMSTVFKSIAYRKGYDSLGILMRYILKEGNTLENELGESISIDQVAKEFNRFDLVKDKDNLKDKNNKSKKEKNRIKDENLKNRQIWHSMFSLPNNFVDNDELFKKVMQESLEELFPGHKYVYGIHNDTKNTHCHIALKTKNDLTKKQIRINPQELNRIHRLIHKKCIAYGINLEGKIEKPKEKKRWENKREIKGVCHRLNNWKEMYKNDKYPTLKVNQTTEDKLKYLGMDEKNILSFLNMYREDKKLAIWSINNNAKLFNIGKPKEAFTLRKVIFIEKENINKENIRVIDKDIDR